MAISKGWNGAIKIGSTAASSEMLNINSWELSLSGDALENTGFGASVYDRGYQPGLRAHTLSFAGYSDPIEIEHKYLLDLQKIGTEMAKVSFSVHFDRATPKGWHGDGVVTGLTISTPIDGLAAFSGNIQVTGGITTSS